MLILAKITGAAASGYADYLQAKTENSELGDYYLKDGERTETPGRWAAGAEQFGLVTEAAVSGEQLHTLMAVRRPDTGQPLRRAGGSGEAVCAIDATFSAPKSVSAVWALADRDLRQRIETAHETAIDRALNYATEQVPMLRRRVAQDTVIHEKAKALVATSWRHTTARAVADQVPDPQLHSHVLLHAAVRKDGEMVAIDSRSWLTHQREVGAAYRTELARELHGLGFQIDRGTGRGQRYFEIGGVPQQLIDRWSSRHQQVQAAIKQRLDDRERELEQTISEGGPAAADAAMQLQVLLDTQQLSPKQERMVGTITRQAKLPVTEQDLDTNWKDTALDLGFSRERVEVLRHARQTSLTAASTPVLLDALTEFDSRFPAREARAVALERSAGAPIEDALDQLVQLRQSDEILVLADGTGTTKSHRGRERTVVAITERLTAETIDPLPARLAQSETRRLDKELAQTGGQLSEEQRDAIDLACGEHQLVVIEGQAGTGKSTTLTGIARAHEAAGQQVIVTSTAAITAQRLADELAEHGVKCQAYSTVGLSTAIDNGQLELTPRTTVIHDEAALASTREQQHLLQAIEKTGARLIAVGDPKQNQPVGAGGLWEHIEHAAHESDAHVELTINQRAREEADRRAQKLFRDGHVERAIRSYAARDHVHFSDDQRRAEDHALEAAQADREAGKSTLVIAQTSNQHLDELNARAQAMRLQNDELGDDSLPVPGRLYELHEGDEVQIRHTLQRGDDEPLRNGTTAEVTDVDRDAREIELRLADEATVRLTEPDISDADLRLSYVQHPFPAQGHTVDTTHLIVNDHATREGSYVGLTRAREKTDIYVSRSAESESGVDKVGLLAERMNRSEPEVPSVSVPVAIEFGLKRPPETRAARGIISPEIDDVPATHSVLTDESLVADGDVSFPPTAEFDQQVDAPASKLGREHTDASDERVWPGRGSRTELETDANREQSAEHAAGFEF